MRSSPVLTARVSRGTGALGRMVANERGVVLLAVMAAVLITTLLLTALVLSSMDESTISRRQQGGAQALFLAEAGAYRALAELRHTLSADLDAALTGADTEELLALCAAGQGWQVVAKYGRAGGDRWTADPATGEAVLRLNGGAPLSIRMPGGEEIGAFTATVRVRAALSRAGETVCRAGDAGTPERYEMWLTYAVEAVGITPRGRRAVRLTNPPERLIPLRIERASVARWGLLVLDQPGPWFGDTTTINGAAHTNGQWWIAGSPTFRGGASSVAATVRFANCGSAVDLPARVNSGGGSCAGDHPEFLAGELRLAAPPVALRVDPPNLTRAALGLPPGGPPVSAADVRLAAAGQVRGGPDLPDGLYIAHDDGTLRHPQTHDPTGIYIRGDVDSLALIVEQGRQVIAVRMAGGTKGGGVWKLVLDPEAEALVVEGPSGSTTYRGAGNGLIYVDGAIRALHGTVHGDTHLTVAAHGPITISDHVVHQLRPGAPGSAAGLLGLYTELEDVRIDGNAAPGDLYIDAVVAAPLGQFGVEGVQELPDRGVLRITGALIAGALGGVGAPDPRTGGYRGYRLQVGHDRRLAGTVPPYVPVTERFMVSWPATNPLYDKPVWEEIPVP